MKLQFFKENLNFESVAKLFFQIAEERYPTADKILQLASKMVDPLTEDFYERVVIKISLLGAIRNMVKEVAPNHLFRSLQHRDDLFDAVIECLEGLEGELEGLEEEEE